MWHLSLQICWGSKIIWLWKLTLFKKKSSHTTATKIQKIQAKTPSFSTFNKYFADFIEFWLNLFQMEFVTFILLIFWNNLFDSQTKFSHFTINSMIILSFQPLTFFYFPKIIEVESSFNFYCRQRVFILSHFTPSSLLCWGMEKRRNEQYLMIMLLF